MGEPPQDWFEMKLIRRRKLASAVWIPLRAENHIERTGRYGFAGFKEEFFGAGTLAVPIDKQDAAKELGWTDVGISHEHGPCIQGDIYIPSDMYSPYGGESLGVHLVLDQRTNRIELSEWHLHQDFVVALRLKRESDSWVSTNQGYIEVARLMRRSDGSPRLLEVRAEHLRDYLCARHLALYVTSYRNRRAVVEDAGHISWAENPIEESVDGDRWEGRVDEIHEGGDPFGSKTAVFHVARSDVDPDEDVPGLGMPTDENVETKSWTIEHEGRKLFTIQGELWRSEWVGPAERSPRVRGDEIRVTVSFVTDAAGTRETRQTLETAGKWLWFRPEVMMALAHRRGGSLGWYTRHTGWVRCSPDYHVHFGVNRIGLINVFAKDIVLLPEWQQQEWAGHNVGPEGGVSEELLASQMRAAPADTQSPEGYLADGLNLVRQLSERNLGVQLLRDHEQVPEILRRSHRFRAVDRSGLFALAKDLSRLTADSIDTAAVHRILSLPKRSKLGSLKSLERLLATKVDPAFARRLVGPLVGTYQLRLADAHLASSQIDDSFQLAGVDQGSPMVHQGLQLLRACVSSIYGIADVLHQWDPDGRRRG